MSNDSLRTSKELLSCPFCGSAPKFGKVTTSPLDEHPNPNEGGEYIECTNPACAASSVMIFPTMAAAKPFLVEKWNRRASNEPSNALREVVQILESGKELASVFHLRGAIIEGLMKLHEQHPEAWTTPTKASEHCAKCGEPHGGACPYSASGEEV